MPKRIHVIQWTGRGEHKRLNSLVIDVCNAIFHALAFMENVIIKSDEITYFFETEKTHLFVAYDDRTVVIFQSQ